MRKDENKNDGYRDRVMKLERCLEHLNAAEHTEN